jgi:hypothetical protein
MTSFGANEIAEGNFMPSFKIQGQVHHLIGRVGSNIYSNKYDSKFKKRSH